MHHKIQIKHSLIFRIQTGSHILSPQTCDLIFQVKYSMPKTIIEIL
jgi:hypothetical protein